MNIKKLLIVDDDDDILHFFRMNLPKDRYEIKTALSAKEGFEILEDFNPDLIILDIKMPEEDGWEMNKKIKKDEKLADIPVAFLTAKEDLSDKLSALKEGIIDYIMKPIKSDQIIKRIENIISKHYE